jgi:hypothetical protein
VSDTSTGRSGPRLLLGDTNGDGTSDVNYLGDIGGGALEQTTYNGAPGSWDVQRTTWQFSTSSSTLGTWLLTDPPVRSQPNDALELRSAVTSWLGTYAPCIDLYPGRDRWATGTTCRAMNLADQPVSPNAQTPVDYNLASIFQMQRVPGVTASNRVYFQSIVPGATTQCLTWDRDIGTRLSLVNCNTSDTSQQFDLDSTYAATGTVRQGGFYKIKNVASGKCMAPRNDGANGIDVYADCTADDTSKTSYGEYVWWQLFAPTVRAPV